MIKSRRLSFLIMFFIYVITILTCVYIRSKTIDIEFCKDILFLDIVATIEIFIFSLIFKNASVYDPYWSVQPIVIVISVACVYGLNSLGILFLFSICYWGIRLTSNWAYTFGGLTHQDWRYTMLKEKTKWFYPVVNFFGIHMIPTVIVFMCVYPVTIVIKNGFKINPLSVIFILVSIIAATCQGIADFQMHYFKKNGGKGFIRIGLWKHSRHPNYLCEILMWWGIDLACFFANPCFMWLIGAFTNTCLFLFISIPLAEKHQSRKPGFDEYKKVTRVLI